MQPEQPAALGRSRLGWLVLTVTVLLLDQLTKAWVVDAMTLGESWALTDFFNLVYVLNPGAAFSFLADGSGWQRWLFTALALGVILFFGGMIFRSPNQRLLCLSASSIIGGAAGNLWDRLAIGAVVDFLDFHWGGWHWPAFNVADIAICLGAFLLILDEIIRTRRGSAS